MLKNFIFYLILFIIILILLRIYYNSSNFSNKLFEKNNDTIITYKYFKNDFNNLNLNNTITFNNSVLNCSCKNGCTPEGCNIVGNSINDCVWATDCNCCNFI